jgi:hypothetical protein
MRTWTQTLALWQRWFRQYREMDLARAEYVNLRHCVRQARSSRGRKGNETYYGIFARSAPRSRRIELPGLDKELYRSTIPPIAGTWEN